MKLTIEQPQLANLINSPSSVVEAKNTIPILGHVKITATNGTVSAMATDLDIEAVTIANIDVDQPGELTVPAKPLEAIVKRLPKSSLVTLEYDGKSLSIKAGRSKFNLQTLPADDFPQLATDEYTHSATIDADAFLHLLNKTKFAMSTEETRYYLNGVYMHNDEATGDLIAVATDGNRLAKMTYKGSVDVAGVIIPRKTVDRLAKMLDGVAGDVALDTSETKLRVSGDGFSITSKVVDGIFPDYGHVIPDSCKATMRVDAKEFSGASGSVAAVADARSKAVRLSVSGDVCSLSGRGDVGEAVSEVSVDYDGEDLEVGFNSVYMADMMAQAEGGLVSVGLGGPMDPARVSFEECPEFVGVVMPLRI